METVIVKKIQNQSVYSNNNNNNNNNNNKQMRTPKKNYTRSFSHSQAPSFNGYGGLFPYPKPSTSLQPSQQFYHQQNPPLLPLPTVPIHLGSSLPCRTRNLSCPNNNNNNIPPRPRGKTNLHKNTPKKQPEPKSNNIVVPSCAVVGSEISFLSPPPSSLPLPRFSLRPTVSKLKSTVGIDACATDSLRQILHIQ